VSSVFIDHTKIFVKAGDGGRGCQSFYRDKYNRVGTPDGGNGGNGASIIFRADRNISTLLDFKFNRHFTGVHGVHGSSKKKRGRNAEDVIVAVPVGTTITDLTANCVLRDLVCDKDEVVVAKGGRGGIGNSSRREATPGEPGEQRHIVLDLKLIAEAGVVGFPNAGKSTLLSAISNAHSKVGAYPFTTKFPILGVVNFNNKHFVIADIPGLIEGSAEGRGLGDKFLRHVERTKILVHIIDMAGFEGRDPLEDYKAINLELKKYKLQVAKKHQIIVANKMDLDGAWENLEKFKSKVKKTVYPISALNREGLEDLVEAIAKRL